MRKIHPVFFVASLAFCLVITESMIAEDANPLTEFSRTIASKTFDIIIVGNKELFDILDHAILAHERAIGPKKLVTIPGIKHYGIYYEARDLAEQEAVAWFEEHLK